MNSKKAAIILMSLVIVIWGAELSVAGALMSTFAPVNVLFFKYTLGMIGLGTIKCLFARNEKTERRDIPKFFVVTFFGIVMYFLCSYTAMRYIPVSVVTVVSAFVPVVSILVDRVFFRRKMTGKIVLGAIGSVVGVGIVIGTDFHALFQGKLIGYLLAFGSVFSWVIYNFLMEPLSRKYSDITIGFNQVVCAFIMVLPLQLGSMPDLTLFRPNMIVGVLYIGLLSAVVGYMVLPFGLRNLGPTSAGIFSNFLPVTSTFFAWLILGQSLGPIQAIGCVIVIVFSCIVIIEVGKRDAADSEDKR